MSPQGQHIELGIAESNLFLQLAAGPLFGTRLLPIGTLYDAFIKRRHDAPNYACYQGARFILAATPSGITLVPEGGAHQSVGEPLGGLTQPGLASFEPAYADELAVLLRWAFEEIQREEDQSVYFRLSTRPIDQPRRIIDPDLAEAIVAGAYWLREPAEGAELAIAYCGAVAPRRSPRIRWWPKTSREPASWRSPRPTACTAIGLRRAPAVKAVSRSGCWRGCGRVRHSSPSAIFTQRPCRGSVPSPATRLSRSVSTALANRAISPISTVPTASTPMRSSTRPPAPASRYCGKRNARPNCCPNAPRLGPLIAAVPNARPHEIDAFPLELG